MPRRCCRGAENGGGKKRRDARRGPGSVSRSLRKELKTQAELRVSIGEQSRQLSGRWARDKTLAAEIALPEATVKTRITELIAMEYVHERPSEKHAGVLHRRVMYTDEDRAVVRSRRPRPGVAADLPAVVARALRSTVR